MLILRFVSYYSFPLEMRFLNFFEKDTHGGLETSTGDGGGLLGFDRVVKSVGSAKIAGVVGVHGVFVVVVNKGRGDMGGTGSAVAISDLGSANTNKRVITRLIVNNPKKRTKTAAATSCSMKFVHTSFRK